MPSPLHPHPYTLKGVRKICFYLDIVKIALTPPLFVFLDTNEEFFFTKKSAKKMSIMSNLN